MTVLIALNRLLRRQRRRLATVVLLFGLAGAVVAAHSVMGADHMDGGVAMCVAVAETAVVAVGVVLLIGAARRIRPVWSPFRQASLPAAFVRPVDPVARAGPPNDLCVLRL